MMEERRCPEYSLSSPAITSSIANDMSASRKTKVIRNPKRGHYDTETLYRILDSRYLCHVGIVHEGYPVVIPMLYGRKDDRLYIHGSSASRLMKGMRSGIDICVEVTRVDGLVLARSAYHHSMNYASAVVFGKATIIEDETKKIEALKVISDHLLPGRWEEVRGPNELELRATMVLSLPISEASAKIRTGDPGDEPEDYELDIWAGVLPVSEVYGKPVPDALLRPDIPTAGSVTAATKKLKSL